MKAFFMIDALVGHLVGDYLLQNDWMALNKKNQILPCAVHCFLWSACVMSFAGWPLYLWPTLFTLHYLQDASNVVRKWMSLIGQDSFATGPCSPWSIIVVDNVWHILTLWAIDKILK